MSTTIDDILDEQYNLSDLRLAREDGFSDWTCWFVYDRCEFGGRGFTAEEALIEALVDRDIADHYYYGDLTGPALTLTEMTARLHAAYVRYLGEAPGHEYRGGYLRSTP